MAGPHDRHLVESLLPHPPETLRIELPPRWFPQVVVVDRRVHFSRINQLHLWAWCGEELKALGARILEPPPSNFGANPDLLHVSISDLQKLLFKVALLLGVEVLL